MTDHATPASSLRAVALTQSVYYVVTGFWPLLSMGTFQLITGRKQDLWLVQTAGALIGTIGAVLGLAGRRRRVTPELALLGAGAAMSLAAIDVVYVQRRVIRPIYLVDAAGELLLAAWWLVSSLPPRAPRTRP